ncbi:MULTISPECIES: NAD(P)/FAD-dependent oxidoreductase [Halomonadaceae]|uniref:FAD-dependent oxidoreductase n=1 Tax=Vreelandella piezotolerans TaxID=2609667 RepID=A0ABQ6XBR9_9GAMM|nr:MULTISPECIES: FAD-dependent oxidoreductase [Halomonas]KAE8438560.1 FAD-dependent oxidoreductase [Halomonas piezotolerans]QJA22757.1 FAD-dependent oxidoreductase [Halomonas piezotolerans]BCB60634.1 FAD-dependent oxidoreductase [Halomonas sp. A020]
MAATANESYPSPFALRVAIVGAGLSGLACAHRLAQQGTQVRLFDKARGPGGRMSSKQRPAATLDLGAQAFTVRDERFARQVDEWRHAGCVDIWPTHRYQASASGWQTHDDGQIRYCGAPRMSAITRYLADGLSAFADATLLLETTITALERQPKGWQLRDAHDNRYGLFDYVVISAPPPQAKALLADWEPMLSDACEERPQRSCWAAWAIFDESLPRLPVGDQWQSLHLEHPALRLVSRNHTKPGRKHQPESLSLLAQLDWSDAHIDATPASAAQQLWEAFVTTLPSDTSLPSPIDVGAHRWRYAQPASPGRQSFLYSESGLALCGDSFRGSRVEDAWLSGNELGAALLGRSV